MIYYKSNDNLESYVNFNDTKKHIRKTCSIDGQYIPCGSTSHTSFKKV